MVGVIGGITISWLEGLKQASRVNESSSFVSTDIFSFDCAYASDSSSSGIQKIFLKTILSNLLILIYFTIAIIFWTLYFLVRRKKIWRNNEFLLNILISIFVISFNQQVNLISLNLSIFECDNIYRNDTPLYHMKSDYDIQCWTGDHLLYSLVIALPMLLFWAIIFPLIILRKIYRFKDQLEDPPQKLHKYAFFFRGYKKQYYYWEVVIFIRKLAAVLVISLAGMKSINFQMYMSVYVMIISVWLHMAKKPYQNP
mmetsp:Transcript_2357/g.2047  ORF Transcript_2357/g.2047 Transcript_2357/m.2047 type:complete len:255 (-) Transcript_2357:82-846(-)